MRSFKSSYGTVIVTLLVLWSSACSAKSWTPPRNLLKRPTHDQKRDAVPAGFTSAPYYPTPHGGWVAEWTDSYAKAALVVGNMTLAEKINMTSGTGLDMV